MYLVQDKNFPKKNLFKKKYLMANKKLTILKFNFFYLIFTHSNKIPKIQ